MRVEHLSVEVVAYVVQLVEDAFLVWDGRGLDIDMVEVLLLLVGLDAGIAAVVGWHGWN